MIQGAYVEFEGLMAASYEASVLQVPEVRAKVQVENLLLGQHPREVDPVHRAPLVYFQKCTDTLF